MVSPGPWPYPTAHPKKRLEWDTAQWNFRRPIGQKRSRVISKRQSRAIDLMMVRRRAVSTQNEMAARYLKSNESCLKSFRTWGGKEKFVCFLKLLLQFSYQNKLICSFSGVLAIISDKVWSMNFYFYFICLCCFNLPQAQTDTHIAMLDYHSLAFKS